MSCLHYNSYLNFYEKLGAKKYIFVVQFTLKLLWERVYWRRDFLYKKNYKNKHRNIIAKCDHIRGTSRGSVEIIFSFSIHFCVIKKIHSNFSQKKNQLTTYDVSKSFLPWLSISFNGNSIFCWTLISILYGYIDYNICFKLLWFYYKQLFLTACL